MSVSEKTQALLDELIEAADECAREAESADCDNGLAMAVHIDNARYQAKQVIEICNKLVDD